MAQSKPQSARRREIRRHIARQPRSVLSTLRRQEVIWAALFASVFSLLGGLLTVYARQHSGVVVDQRVDTPVVTRVEFAAVDHDATTEARERAARDEPAIYSANTSYLSDLNAQLYNLVQLAGTAETIADVATALPEDAPLTDETLLALQLQYVQGNPSGDWERSTRQFLQRFFELAVLEPEAISDIGLKNTIRIVHPDPRGSRAELPRGPSVLYPVDQPRRIGGELDRLLGYFAPSVRPLIKSIVLQDLQPTYLPDPIATGERRQEAYDAIEPVINTYQAGQILVSAGESATPRQIDLIDRERRAFQQTRSRMSIAAETLGLIGLIALIAIGQWAYIMAFARRVAENPMRGLAFTSLTLGMLGASVVAALTLPQVEIFGATLPIILTTMVLAVVYKQRFALAMGAGQAVVTALALDQSAGELLVGLIGVGVVAALLDEVRTTSTLVRTGFFAGLGMAVCAGLAEASFAALKVDEHLMEIMIVAAASGASGLVAGFIMQGLVPYIEKLFRVTTAMTLKELNDASNPLLQRMAQDAPGTYAHSLRIADMAEAAADSIGADGLLCRVGAMYHDIGKINKPSYFIENQAGGPNRHAKLSPAMSLLIIVGHVKDGVEMAREFGLPQSIRHFIESHHGTTLVEYFYHAAKKQKEAESEAVPSEFEFRYPGPKPQTRETAIMLLCDSIEAAARTLPEPTAVRIEQLVHTLAMKRLMDGQFDDANLTLAELSRVEASVTKTLSAIYHARIKYPDGKSSSQEKADAAQAGRSDRTNAATA